MCDQTAHAQESIKFLERDFNQCFEQMRHYNSQISNMCKFIWTAYTVLFTFIIGCHKHALDNPLYASEMRMACTGGLIVALAFGLCLYGIIVRNRIYFVLMARYINEHRGFFLSTQPLGFRNNSGNYDEWKSVPYFNPMSSQSFFMYITCFFNGIITGILSYHLLGKYTCLSANLVIGVASFCLLLILTIGYLKSKDNKKAHEAVGHTKKI